MIEPIVYVVDDDEGVRDGLRWLIESAGHKVETFRSAEDFLASYDPNLPACLVLDVRMPGMSGLELQQELAKTQPLLPILFISAHGTVTTAVRALRAGATDFLEKPFNNQTLLARIDACIASARKAHEVGGRYREVRVRHERLTPRECEVMQHVAAGESNKVIAAKLRVSAKTIEAHRASVMRKMRARSLAELVEMALLLKSPPGKP